MTLFGLINTINWISNEFIKSQLLDQGRICLYFILHILLYIYIRIDYMM